MIFHSTYWIILATLGLFNQWLVRQNYHKSFVLGGTVFTTPLYDKYSFQLNILNIILWILVLVLGIYWDVYWWLTPIIIFISYRDGRKRALKREYQALKERELREGIKDLNGNPRTAEEELIRLLEIRRKKLSGFYNIK